MAKISKRVQALRAKVDRNKVYPVAEALTLIKECATAKFDESIDVAVNLLWCVSFTILQIARYTEN